VFSVQHRDLDAIEHRLREIRTTQERLLEDRFAPELESADSLDLRALIDLRETSRTDHQDGFEQRFAVFADRSDVTTAPESDAKSHTGSWVDV